MASRNISVSETSRPKLPRHAKLKFDETRQVWVILAPERVLAPDEIAVEVLHLCDGVRSVADMVDQLAEKYAAPREAIAKIGTLTWISIPRIDSSVCTTESYVPRGAAPR